MKPNGNGLEAQKSKGPTLLRLPRYASGKKKKNNKKKPLRYWKSSFVTIRVVFFLILKSLLK